MSHERWSAVSAEGKDGIVVIGAGGHAKVVISTLTARGVAIAAVFDDDDSKWGMDAQGNRVRSNGIAAATGSSGSGTTGNAGRWRKR